MKNYQVNFLVPPVSVSINRSNALTAAKATGEFHNAPNIYIPANMLSACLTKVLLTICNKTLFKQSVTHCLLSSPGGGVLPCPSITKSSCSTCKGKHHRSATASHYGVTHSKGPFRTTSDWTALLSLMSMHTPGVPISFMANVWVSLSAPGARFLKLTAWMRLSVDGVFPLTATTSLMAEWPFFSPPFFTGAIMLDPSWKARFQLLFFSKNFLLGTLQGFVKEREGCSHPKLT